MNYVKRLVFLALFLVFFAPVNGYSQTANGIWISRNEIASLPTSGAAWDHLKYYADQPAGTPNLSNQDETANIYTLAKALVYARTGIESYRTEVIGLCMSAIDTELQTGSRVLSLARKLVTYVISAELVGLPPDKNEIFKAWLRRTLTEVIDTQTLQWTDEHRPNNWGMHAGASRAAVALYLGDSAELARTATVFQGWQGERNVYAGFTYGTDLSWQCDPAKPVGINPPGCTRDGNSLDGVLPDDERRAGAYVWPPPKENYVYEALQGALVEAEILRRAGYDSFNWSNKALLRAFLWLHDVDQFPAQGDDTWQPHLVNYWYGSTFPAPIPAYPGKNMGFTDWTHGPGRAKMPLSPIAPAPPPSPPPPPTLPPPPPPTVTYVVTRVQENNPAVTYAGTWYTDVLSAFSGGTAAKSVSMGARATFNFTGTAAKWIAYRDKYSGIANIYVDDVLRWTVDLYSSQVQANIGAYTVSNLPYAAHKLTIEVSGKKSSAAKGRTIWVDAFEYTAPSTSALATQPDTAVASNLTSVSVASTAANAAPTLTVGYGLISTGHMGYALLQHRETGTLVSQANVPGSPLLDAGRISVELSDGMATGLAIANPNSEPSSVDFYFTDENGADSGFGTFAIPAQGQIARFLSEAPFNATAPFRGTLTFLSSSPVVATTLRGHWNERSEFTMSTMPAVQLSPVGSEPLVIPHYAFGQGWNMQVILINPTDDTLQGSIQLSGGGTFNYSIAPRAQQRVDFPANIPDLRTGAISITPAAGAAAPAGVAVFSYRPNGVMTTETSVLASLPGPAFQIDVESGSSARSGLAVLNNSDDATVVNFDLTDSASGAQSHVARTFGPHERIALFLDEIPGLGKLGSSHGVLRVSSANSSLAVTGLHTTINERGDLLLATTETIDERETNGNSSFFVPHFAAGPGFESEFIVFGQGAIQLFDQTGQQLAP